MTRNKAISQSIWFKTEEWNRRPWGTRELRILTEEWLRSEVMGDKIKEVKTVTDWEKIKQSS